MRMASLSLNMSNEDNHNFLLPSVHMNEHRRRFEKFILVNRLNSLLAKLYAFAHG